jgi:tagaturonate reductase
MQNITDVLTKPNLKETVIQFGEGGFLRGFVDWMFQKLNESGKYEGGVVVVQPIDKGMCDKLAEQNCLYTHVMRGMENGEPVVRKDKVNIISRCVKPYDDYSAFLALAENPDFRVIVSNTTEAGIEYIESDKLSDAPPKSFPAKLTALLYKRYGLGLPGFILLPCELIDKNGAKLREIVLKYAEDWKLESGFIAWIKNENHFCNTLVDRIVTGYPRDEDMALGYIDNMVNTSEVFHLWVIEGDKKFAGELPFDKIGLNVIWTDNLEMYRTRKVRILNGAHTSMVPYAMLRGLDTVKSCIDDAHMNAFLKKCVFDEIIPTLDLPHDELTDYANNVIERFSNPFIKHFLSSIALNSVSKFKVRVLPSILEYIKRFNKYPETLMLSFASLIKFYKTDMANDDKDIMEFMKTASTKEILANVSLWDEDLSDMYDEVSKHEN